MKKLVLFSSILVSAVMMTACATNNTIQVNSSTTSSDPFSISIPEIPKVDSTVETNENGNAEEVTAAGKNETGDLSDSLDDFTFSLNGTVYQLPMKYSDFTSGEWKIDSAAGVDETEELAGRDSTNFWVTNGTQQIEMYAYNTSGNTEELKDCYIGGINYYKRDGADFKIAKGFSLDQNTSSDVTAEFGNPTSYSSSSTKDHYIYDSSNGGETRFDFDNSDSDESRIELRYMPDVQSGSAEVSSEKPSYLSAYKAPTQLSDDPTATQMELDGDLYQMPCPVTEFTDNGWSIDSINQDSVPAQSSITVNLEKGDHSEMVSLTNFDTSACLPENAAVTQIFVNSYKGSEDQGDFAKMPGNITLSSTESDLDRILTAYQKMTSGSQITYSYSASSRSTTGIRYQLRPSAEEFSVSIANDTWAY